MIAGSIRGRLLLSLLGALALAALVVGAITYRNALDDAEGMFDYLLRQMALSLRDQGEIAAGDAPALRDEQLDFVIQIWSIDGRQVYASRPHRDLPSRTVLGLAEVSVDGERWRTFGVASNGRVIQVAQPLRIRRNLAAQAALRSVLPLAAVAPLLAAVLGWLITTSLKPLSLVADQVRARDVATLQPLADAGLPDEVAPLVRSLNALLARLSDAFAIQRAFVADAAHELRTPLTALKLQAEVIRRAADPAARSEAVDALQAGVERAAHLIEQMLSLARHEPGAPAEAHAPVALGQVLREVLADVASFADARGSRLSLDADDGVRVNGDASALAVLARNLIDNALRYTPPGGRVQVDLKRDGDGVLLQVDDDGPGIPADERERVLDRFARGSSAGETTGSGLGLAIAQSIAQRHGSTLRLEASPLGGLRVALRLPSRSVAERVAR